MKVFCIDGLVVDIGDHEITEQELEDQLFIPVASQPNMAAMLGGRDITYTSLETGEALLGLVGGSITADWNDDSEAQVTDVDEHGEPIRWE